MTDQSPSRLDPTARPVVVILGGSGFLGRALCRQLSSRGEWRVIVTTRRRNPGDPMSSLPDVGIEQVDALSEDALSRVLDRADAVVNLIAILHGSSKQFHDVHIKLPDLLGRTVRKLSGRRLIHVSAIGVDDPRDSMYLQSKSWGERLVAEAWPPATILRPSVIFGSEDRFINTFAKLQRFVPVVPLACSQARFQPVWVEDVASAIVAALRTPETSGRTFECAGPDVLMLRDLVRRAGQWAGVARPIIDLPLPLAKVQAFLMEHLPGEPMLTLDNLRSMQTPNVAAPGSLALRDLGIQARSLDDYLFPG